ncbi:MAG: PilZ domain-containing protein [Desulfobacteraceae bacterium]|jgi:hypothetical protein
MVKLRRQYIDVTTDRRTSQRIEFHYPIVILGIDENAQILDFSPDGFYVELSSKRDLAIGRRLNLALRLPTEQDVLKIRARVAYKDAAGIGCQLVDTTPKLYASLERCFNIFNATLPIE